MKKSFFSILAIIVILSAGSATAFASGGNRCCFDGVSRNGFCAFVDADGDGVCDNAGKGASCKFVDADGDGVCDNAKSRKSVGTSSRHIQRNRRGNCSKGRCHR